MTLDQEIKRPVRLIPSCNIVIPNGAPVTYSLLTDRDVLLATGLNERVAKRFAELHNANL